LIIAALSQGAAAKRLGVNDNTLALWYKLGLVPAESKPHQQRIAYPAVYIEGLVRTTGSYPLTTQFVELCWLENRYRNGCSKERQEAVQRCKQLQAEGRVLDVAQASKQLWLKRNSVIRCCLSGRLRRAKVANRLYLPAADIKQHAKVLTWPGTDEAADMLGVTPRFIHAQFREGKLAGRPALDSSVRFERCTLTKYQQEHLACPDGWLSGAQVAATLGVGGATVSRWMRTGLLESRFRGKLRLYNPVQIQQLLLQFNTLNPGFEWLEATLGPPPSTVTATGAMRMLNCKRSTVSVWSRTNLLPYYSRTPLTDQMCKIRDFHRLYIFGLIRHANGRPLTRSLLIGYREQCAGAGQVI
jgi:DNA-binding transcriptional MerR regulator